MLHANERRTIKRAGVSWAVTMLSAQGEVEGEIENVSSKGAFISCSDIPPLEGSFQMVVKAPDYKSMFLGGKVVWSTVLKPEKGEPRLGIDVQFTRMSAGDRRFIHSAIAGHYHEKTNRRAGKK